MYFVFQLLYVSLNKHLVVPICDYAVKMFGISNYKKKDYLPLKKGKWGVDNRIPMALQIRQRIDRMSNGCSLFTQSISSNGGAQHASIGL